MERTLYLLLFKDYEERYYRFFCSFACRCPGDSSSPGQQQQLLEGGHRLGGKETDSFWDVFSQGVYLILQTTSMIDASFFPLALPIPSSPCLLSLFSSHLLLSPSRVYRPFSLFPPSLFSFPICPLSSCSSLLTLFYSPSCLPYFWKQARPLTPAPPPPSYPPSALVLSPLPIPLMSLPSRPVPHFSSSLPPSPPPLPPLSMTLLLLLFPSLCPSLLLVPPLRPSSFPSSFSSSFLSSFSFLPSPPPLFPSPSSPPPPSLLPLPPLLLLSPLLPSSSFFLPPPPSSSFLLLLLSFSFPLLLSSSSSPPLPPPPPSSSSPSSSLFFSSSSSSSSLLTLPSLLPLLLSPSSSLLLLLPSLLFLPLSPLLPPSRPRRRP
ncbi:hypothetical protein C7M84_013893 [Penaeus vannamei]|uniref:Uncharacterized protein n=1 Tax=Penaeus vannamei TaxID=6689 RepID=A0A3R7NVQ3_PENVA|nr:hypothetical protein C7M84_013893 [Penaeus vannamei]